LVAVYADVNFHPIHFAESKVAANGPLAAFHACSAFSMETIVSLNALTKRSSGSHFSQHAFAYAAIGISCARKRWVCSVTRAVMKP